LRSETSLTQTIGRAARHVEGKVIMYADRITDSMQKALNTTNARRAVQQAYNEAHGIEPRSIMKAVHDLTDDIAQEREMALADGKGKYTTVRDLPKAELAHMVIDLEKQMKQAAQNLEFERAAVLRDQIVELRQIMALKEAGSDKDLPAWERMRLLDEAGIAYDPGD
jgi:excinuclease ABC subunit B